MMKRGDYFKARIGNRTIFVQIASTDNETVSAWRVKENGERFETETKDTVSFHLIVCKKQDLRQQMQMNMHYGELQPVEITETR